MSFGSSVAENHFRVRLRKAVVDILSTTVRKHFSGISINPDMLIQMLQKGLVEGEGLHTIPCAYPTPQTDKMHSDKEATAVRYIGAFTLPRYAENRVLYVYGVYNSKCVVLFGYNLSKIKIIHNDKDRPFSHIVLDAEFLEKALSSEAMMNPYAHAKRRMEKEILASRAGATPVLLPSLPVAEDASFVSATSTAHKRPPTQDFDSESPTSALAMQRTAAPLVLDPAALEPRPASQQLPHASALGVKQVASAASADKKSGTSVISPVSLGNVGSSTPRKRLFLALQTVFGCAIKNIVQKSAEITVKAVLDALLKTVSQSANYPYGAIYPIPGKEQGDDVSKTWLAWFDIAKNSEHEKVTLYLCARYGENDDLIAYELSRDGPSQGHSVDEIEYINDTIQTFIDGHNAEIIASQAPAFTPGKKVLSNKRKECSDGGDQPGQKPDGGVSSQENVRRPSF